MSLGSHTTMTEEELQERFEGLLASFKCSVPSE